MLRPTFLSFETAKRALSTSQMGLDTVGHNIANVNTPGYTRQRVDQVSLSFGAAKAKFASYNVNRAGHGSTVTGVNQIRDPFLDKRYRTEAAGVGEKAAIGDGLAEINAVFDEITKTGSHAKLGEFLTTLDKLISEADSKENATVLRNMAQQVCQVLNANSTSLNNVMKQQQEELTNTVNDVNIILEQIANLNKKIKEENFYGSPANELNDQRNLLIDQLSELVDIQVTHTPKKISDDLVVEELSIELKGTSPAVKLVDSGEFLGLNVKFNEDPDSPDFGTASIHLQDGISGFEVHLPGTDSSDLTANLFTGSIKGTLDVLNGKGPYATTDEKSFRGIPYYRRALNEFSVKLAETMNAQNEVKIMASDGSGEYASLSRPLFVSNDGKPLSAANMTVSQDWQDDPMYITTSAKNNALRADPSSGELYDASGALSGIKVSQIDRIGANGQLLDASGTVLGNMNDLQRAWTESENGHTAGDGVPTDELPGANANDNLTGLKLALTSKDTLFPNSFVGSFQEYLVSFQGDMALDKELNDSLLDASLTVLNGLADGRDAVSAVSIDEEGINMMTYQNFYNAAARYMTVLDEALGTVIQGMGVVGR